MTNAGSASKDRIRSVLLAVFAVCTLWLIVQNLVLLVVVPWHDVLVRLSAGRVFAPFRWIQALPMGLVPMALGLGWIVAGRPERSAERRSS